MRRGFRWVETGYDVWMLEDDPRHFRGGVSILCDGTYAWSVTGGPSFSESYTWKPETRWVMCGESPTKKAAMDEVENIVFAIHDYCRKTTFGEHEYALFEFEKGKPVVRAVGSGAHVTQHLKPGGLIVDVARYRNGRLNETIGKALKRVADHVHRKSRKAEVVCTYREHRRSYAEGLEMGTKPQAGAKRLDQ